MTVLLPPAGPLPGTTEQLRRDRDRVTEALVDAQDQLVALGAVLRVSTDTLEEDEVLARTLAEALGLTGSDAAAHRRPGAPELAVVLRPGLPATVAAQLRADPTSAPATAAVDLPGTAGEQLLLARADATPFTTGDLRMAETLAATLATLTRLARLHREGVARATIEREHRLASELAQAALPTAAPVVPGVEVFAACRQAAVTGGDLVVFAEVGEALWFAVGDVAGKGLPAATVMTRAVSALRVAFLTHPADDPAAAVAAVSAELADFLDSAERFVTAVVGTVDRAGVVHLCNAGHSPVLHRAVGADPVAVPPTCPPIGVPFGVPATTRLVLDPGAVLVLGTDGLAEQADPAGELLGYDAVRDACAATGTATELGGSLLAVVDAHAAGTPASDDCTLVVLRATGGAP